MFTALKTLLKTMTPHASELVTSALLPCTLALVAFAPLFSLFLLFQFFLFLVAPELLTHPLLGTLSHSELLPWLVAGVSSCAELLIQAVPLSLIGALPCAEALSSAVEVTSPVDLY